MKNISVLQQDSLTVNRDSAGNSQRATTLGVKDHGEDTSEEELTPKRETHPRKHGFLWGSAEKIDGIIDPKQHVDWVMMSQFGISLEYLINFVHNLCDHGYSRNETFEAVTTQFGFDEMHADVVSDSVFGESFYALIEDIHGWISDYEPEEDDGWSDSKRGMHHYVVWAVMEDLAFGKMDEVNPNPD
jgi:hypothetical protein